MPEDDEDSEEDEDRFDQADKCPTQVTCKPENELLLTFC